MVARFAKTVSVGTTAGFQEPPPVVGGRIRIQNLEASGGNSVWLALGSDTVAAAEGDDAIRINPGESYVTDQLQRLNLIAVGGTVRVLLESF